MAINWQANPNTPNTAWTNLLSVSSLFVKPLQQFCYKSALSLLVMCGRHSWGDAPRPRISLLSYSLDKLFATMQTILVSFTSAFCVFLFSTLLDGDVFIHHLATHRAKAHRGVSAPVIKVGAIVSPRYHLFSPIHPYFYGAFQMVSPFLSSIPKNGAPFSTIPLQPAPYRYCQSWSSSVLRWETLGKIESKHWIHSSHLPSFPEIQGFTGAAGYLSLIKEILA